MKKLLCLSFCFILLLTFFPISAIAANNRSYIYIDEQSNIISRDNATLYGIISNPDGLEITDIGIILSKASSNSSRLPIGTKTEKYLSNARYSKIGKIWYNIKDELSLILEPNTQYEYTLFAYVGGVKRTVDGKFTTLQATNLGSISIDQKRNSIGRNNATVYGIISNPNGLEISDVGIVLSANKNNACTLLGTKTEKYLLSARYSKSGKIWYNIQDELGVTLQPETKYEYSLFAYIGGIKQTTYGTFTTLSDKIQPAIWFMSVVNVSQGVDEGSHAGTLNFDVVGTTDIFAPFDCTVKDVYPSGYDFAHTVVIESENDVQYADGTIDKMTLAFAHDNDISDIHVGDKYKQGEVFYQIGHFGPASGDHAHVMCIKGTYAEAGNSPWKMKSKEGNFYPKNQIRPDKALFVADKITTVNEKKTKGFVFKRLDDYDIKITKGQ